MGVDYGVVVIFMFTEEELANEEWRDVDGHEGYQISSLGRFRSITMTIDDGRTIRTFHGKILKQHISASGSLQVYPTRPKKTNLSVSKTVANAFVENPNNKEFVLHKNLDTSDCRADNLVWASIDEVKAAYESWRHDNSEDGWVNIDGADGLYQICRDGRARVHDKVVRVKNGYKVKAGQLLKPLIDECGRSRYRLTVDGKKSTERTDVLVAKAFIPGFRDGMFLLHIDGDVRNCAIENLATITEDEYVAMNKWPFVRSVRESGESWRDVDGFPLYMVSDYGRVLYLPCILHLKDGRPTERQGGILKPFVDEYGYRHVMLTNESGVKRVSVHRLVAKAFLFQPDGCDVVNHLDQTPGHDEASNLEWTTPRGNCIYGDAIERRVKNTDWVASGLKRWKPVLQFDLNGGFVKKWNGAVEIERGLGINNALISMACNRKDTFKRGYTSGYIWTFEEDFQCAS